MILLKQQIKLLVIVLSIIALVTGFTSVAHMQSVHAFSIDFSGLPEFYGNGAPHF